MKENNILDLSFETNDNKKKKTTKAKRDNVLMVDLDSCCVDFIRGVKFYTKDKSLKNYINTLIKSDMCKRLGLPKGSSEEKIQAEWESFKAKLEALMNPKD